MHSCDITILNISEALDSHQRLPPCLTMGAPPRECTYLIPIHYSRLSPIHIHHILLVKWAASPRNCRDVFQSTKWRKMQAIGEKLLRTVKRWNIWLLHEILCRRFLCVWVFFFFFNDWPWKYFHFLKPLKFQSYSFRLSWFVLERVNLLHTFSSKGHSLLCTTQNTMAFGWIGVPYSGQIVSYEANVVVL